MTATISCLDRDSLCFSLCVLVSFLFVEFGISVIYAILFSLFICGPESHFSPNSLDSMMRIPNLLDWVLHGSYPVPLDALVVLL